MNWILDARAGAISIVHNKRLTRILSLLLRWVWLGLELLLVLLLQMKPVFVELLNGRFTGSWQALVAHYRTTGTLTAMIEEISRIRILVVHAKALRVGICSDHTLLITLLLDTVSELVYSHVLLQLFHWILVRGER